MKSKSFRIISRYVITIVLIAMTVLVLNYAVLLCFVRCSPFIKQPDKTVKAIAQELSENNNQLSSETSEMIKRNNMWVQLVNPKGDVIYSSNRPNDICDYYSLKDIAGLSRNYLNDYPVFIWESKENLVIAGYPKYSISKYNWFVPVNAENSMPMTLMYMILFNAALAVILSICLGKFLNKPLSRLMDGVFSLNEEKKLCLEEKGMFRDLAESMNETSRIIMEKNNKIKLRDNAVENWIAAISHDVRTPLSMILGYSAMIEEDATLPEEIHGQARIISENSMRLKELVENLNLATSLQYNMQPLMLIHTRAANIAREALASCINSGLLQDCTAEIVVEDETTAVLADGKLLSRALINLITNSAKHNKDGCHIKVIVPRTTAGSPHVSIMVADDGSGISQDEMNKINQSDYFHVPANQKHGLGLIIVRNIAEAHHGSFIIENGKNEGAVATLKIPKAQEPSADFKGCEHSRAHHGSVYLKT